MDANTERRRDEEEGEVMGGVVWVKLEGKGIKWEYDLIARCRDRKSCLC